MAGVTASTTGTFPVPLELKGFQRGAGVALLITVPNGVTVQYTVQVSGDPQTSSMTFVNWNAHDTLGTTQTASANGNIAYPCTAVQLTVASISGGSITMNVIQTDA